MTTHPEHDGELLKFVNTWLVEVAFGVYDREDLPNLAHEMLEEFAAHTAKEVAAAQLAPLKDMRAEWYTRRDGTLEPKPDDRDDWLGCDLYERIERLESQLQANNKEELENE